MKRKLLNLAIFQLGWAVCVLGGDAYAIAFTLAALLLHHFTIMRDRAEWWLILGLSTLGIAWDSLLINVGVLTPAGGATLLAPLWLGCLWLLFSTTLAHCLEWLARRLPLAIALTAIFAPLTYWIGGRLADVELAAPLALSLLVIAVGWSLLVPAGLLAARRLQS